MDLSYLGQLALSFLPGIKYTLGLFAITLVISLPLGLGLAFLRSGKNVVLKNLTALYVWLLRGTPLLLQLFFVYFGLCFIPGIGKYLTFDRFPAACIAFVLNYAAYFCEIFRGGLLSVNKGQYEAARVLGFSPRLTNTKIVIPQMLRVCLPPVTLSLIHISKPLFTLRSLRRSLP